MTRSLINFISSTWFDWEPSSLINNLPGASFKFLNKNKSSGEITLLFKFPKNTYHKKTIISNYNEEIYILDGSLEFSGNILNKDFYTYNPIGYKKNFLCSLNGSIGFVFLNKKLVKSKINNSFYPNFEHKSWIPRINAFENIWQPISDNLKSIDIYNAGARIKFLRKEKKNSQSTFLVGFPPLWSMPESKNVGGDIELFLISGNINTSRGLMKPGSYLSIPKGSVIQKMHSKESAVFLCKSHKSFNLRPLKKENIFNYMEKYKRYDCIIPKKILLNIKTGPYSRLNND